MSERRSSRSGLGAAVPYLQAGVQQVAEQRQQQAVQAQKAWQQDREFMQRLQLAGIEAGMKSGAVEPTFGPQGQMGMQMNTPEAVTPEVQQQVQQHVQGLQSRPGFVSGPQGGLITGSSVEAAPGFMMPPQQAMQQIQPMLNRQVPAMAQQLAGQRQQSALQRTGQQKPVMYSNPDTRQMSQVGTLPHNAELIRGSRDYGFGVTGGGLMDSGSQADPAIADRIKQALASGVPREKVLNDLQEKGIDPALYGL